MPAATWRQRDLQHRHGTFTGRLSGAHVLGTSPGGNSLLVAVFLRE